jgi:hypothetical protein
MNRLPVLSLVLTSALGCLCVVHAAAPSTLALVDVSLEAKLPAELAERLFAAFSESPQVKLVERDRIDLLLKEQALASALSGGTTERIVALGKLCQAEAFIMVEAIQQNQRTAALRVRVVETRYGLRLSDGLEAIAPENDLAGVAARIRDRSLTAVGSLPDLIEDLLLVGISAFRSEEVSRRWDWLSEALSAGLGLHLGLTRGVLLLERERTRPLTEERGLTDQLPEALQPSAVLIDGGFRLNPQTVPPGITVHCRCRRAAGAAVELSVSDDLGNLDALCGKLSRAILDAQNKATTPLRLDVDAEALALATEANAYKQLRDFGRALAPAEAAVALAPRNPACMVLLVQVIHGYLARHCAKAANPCLAFVEQSHWFSRAASIATALLEDEAVRPGGNAEHPWGTLLAPVLGGLRTDSVDLFPHTFAAAENLLTCWPYIEPGTPPNVSAPDLAARLSDLRADHRALYDALRRAAQSQRNGRFTSFRSRPFYLLAKHGYAWSESARDALKVRSKLLADTAALLRTDNEEGRGDCFYVLGAQGWGSIRGFVSFPLWPEKADETQRLYRQLCARLLDSEEILLRAHAETVLVLLESWDGHDAEARKHLHRFMEMVPDGLAPVLEPRYGGVNALDSWFWMLTEVGRFAADESENTEFQAGILGDRAAQIVASRHALRILACQGTVDRAARLLAATGQAKRAADLLGDALPVLEHWQPAGPLEQREVVHVRGLSETFTQARDGVIRDHGLAPPVRLPGNLRWEPLFAAATLNADLAGQPWPARLRSLVRTDTGVAVAYSVGNRPTEQYGVAWLDGKKARLAAHQRCRDGRPGEQVSGPTQYRDGVWGPALATEGGTVYLGTAGQGLFVFHRDQAPQRLTEDDGWLANATEQLDILDGKLYALVGTRFWPEESTGVAELDLTTRASRLLWSRRDKTRSTALSGLPIRGIAADAAHKRLYVLSGNDPADQDRQTLYAYETATGELTAVAATESAAARQGSGGDVFAYVYRFERELVIDGTLLLQFDLDTQKSQPLLALPGLDYACEPRWRTRTWTEAKPVPAGEGLILLTPTDILYFRQGQVRPLSLLRCVFPDGKPQTRIRAALPSDKGLYMLTEEQLGILHGVCGTPRFGTKE